jgi:uncharacterized membrane protein YeaQ/YmgE (transglycosylase-associated protein family)
MSDSIIGGFFVGWLLFGLLFGLVCDSIWKGKGGSPGTGFLLGFLLGLIGLLIVAIATPGGTAGAPGFGTAQPHLRTRECPFCKTSIRRDASVCPHCQRESEPWQFHNGLWWVHRDDGAYWLNERLRPPAWTPYEPPPHPPGPPPGQDVAGTRPGPAVGPAIDTPPGPPTAWS